MAKFDYLAFARYAESRWNLDRSSYGSVFGAIDGQPLHLFTGTDNGGNAFLGISVAAPAEDAAEFTKARWVEEMPFLRDSMIEARPDDVVAVVPARVIGRLTHDELGASVEQMVAIAIGYGRVAARHGSRPALVNAVPMFLTESEANDYTLRGSAAASEYAGQSVRWLPGVALGLLATAVSAAIWAGLAVATDREFWLVAIGAGLLIAFATVWGAGKTNVGLQIVIGALTFASVFLGQILSIWWVLSRDFVGVQVGDLAHVYRLVIEEDISTLLFALGGGLLGAWYGVRAASKPQLVPEIEFARAG